VNAGPPTSSRDPAARLRHELRTPLNHIIGYGELLCDEAGEGANAALRPELEEVCAAGRRALTLVNDLLDPARPPADTADAARIGAALRSQIAQVVARSASLQTRAGEEGGDALRADLERIEAAAAQMLALLAGDALEAVATRAADRDAVVPRFADAAPIADAAGGQGGTVLVVDDNATNRDMLARRLERLGYDVRLAEGGAEALAMLAETAVDVILLDIVMPGMSGFDVLARRREDARLRDTPVVMISALDEVESVARCIELGADDYLPKPFDPVILRARVGAVLERKRLRDQERGHLATIEAQAAALAEWNRTLEARVQTQVEEIERFQRLRRFFSPQLAEVILGSDEQLLESHRREVTVVFVDLRGFTAFAESAEPEDVMGVLREYHDAFGPLIFAHEGTLDRFAGDGLMVFFNDPVPCDDPALRAVRMALAMRERAAELIAGWRRRGHDLDFGVGIATGYATCGQIGFEGRFDYTAIGTVTNLAARLCAEAKPRQILISQRVYVTLEDLIEAERIEDLTLKGFQRPVLAYDLLGLRASAGDPDPPNAADTNSPTS
jgi:class 3 adenylate cyclase